MPQFRRLLAVIGMLILTGKSVQTIHKVIQSFLFKAKSSTPPLLLFSTFLKDLQNQKVQKVLLATDYFLVHAKGAIAPYRVLIPSRTESTYLVNTLVRAGVEFGALQPRAIRRILPFLITMVPFIYLALTYRMLRSMFGSEPGIGKDGNQKKGRWSISSQQNRITFNDVAGIDKARRELEEIVDFLKNPSRYESIGARIPKGVMLCGPSGTGKTLLARALASEAGVAFLFCSASDFVEMLVGRGAARVRELFTQASQYSRCIIFIDEIDALAKARGGINSNDEREQTLNQLLTEMDGFEGNSNGVIVIAATNRPEVLDQALCRPGRFDRHVYVGLPDCAGRESILRVHCQKIRLSPDVELHVIAEECGRMGQVSGAQLANLVNEAALLAVRHEDTTVKQWHFQLALAKVLESQTKHTGIGKLYELEVE